MGSDGKRRSSGRRSRQEQERFDKQTRLKWIASLSSSAQKKSRSR